MRTAVALVLLLAAGVAPAESPCDAVVVEALLDRWIHAQDVADRAELEATIAEDGFLVAKGHGKTYERNREEFIEEKLRDRSSSSMAVVNGFQPVALTCAADGQSAQVVRRGCSVFNMNGSPTEIAQTERIEVGMRSGRVVVVRSLSTLDAMRVDGKVILQDRDFVNLQACADALGSK